MHLTDLLHNPIARGALSGLMAAAAVDLHAFLAWKSVEEFTSYSWKTAAFRWVQGAVAGAITAAGFGALIA